MTNALQSFLKSIVRWIYFAIGVSLLLLSVGMIMTTFMSMIPNVVAGKLYVYSILNGVGAIIISVAVLDLAKFVLEEEIIRERELRSVREVRESLTKFMTIIIIAMSLESLVMVFEISGSKNFRQALYPTALMLTTVFALIGLGIFQWLSRQSEISLLGPPTRPAEVTDSSPVTEASSAPHGDDNLN